jgi:hypothetical protein
MSNFDGRQIVENVDKTASPFESVGAPGTAIYSGFIVEGEKDQRLTGRQKYITYSNYLANTAIVAAGVRFFLNIVAKAGWSVDPYDESPLAIEYAEKVERWMHNMTTPWHRVVRRAAMYRFYGFSIQEWTMFRDEDGAIRYMDIEPRPQQTIERWDTDRSGTVQGVIQRSPQTQEDLYIPRGKCIYMVDDTINDSPEGLGLFRHLAKVAARLERYEILEGWGFERDLRGTPIGRGPLAELEKMVTNGTLTNAQAEALRYPIETWIKNALKGKDTSLFLDSSPYRSTGEQQTPSSTRQWDIELLQGDGGPHEQIAAAIERCNREAARILGIEQLLLGSDSAGSFALSRDKSQNFGLLVDGTLLELRKTFEKDFLDPLFELNGWDKKLKPTFKTEQVQYRDIEQIAEVLVKMSQAGAPLAPNDPAINAMRDLAGLPAAPEEDMTEMAIPLTAPEEPVVPEVEEQQ